MLAGNRLAEGDLQSRLYPPVHYSALWLILAVALAALIVGWYVFVWLHTRAKVDRHAGRPGRQSSAADRREFYLDKIARVAEAHAGGRLSDRGASAELSSIVRSCVDDTAGSTASRMTLGELKSANEPVAALVELVYPGEFGPNPSGAVTAAVAAARELVMS